MRVYVIAESDKAGKPCAPVKVGFSANPRARMCELQSGNPRKLILYAVWRMETEIWARRLERDFHKDYDGFRLVGEWFDVSPEEARKGVESWLEPDEEATCARSA
jgi:hypothetical protein